jgi:flagellum-specific peptidoglycan hydrolase FlgJ
MSRDEVKQAWITVGDELSALGLKLKYHFEEEMSESQAEEAKNALKKMADALEDSVESVANAAKDTAVRDDLRGAAQAFIDAVAATATEVGEELRPGKD